MSFVSSLAFLDGNDTMDQVMLHFLLMMKHLYFYYKEVTFSIFHCYKEVTFTTKSSNIHPSYDCFSRVLFFSMKWDCKGIINHKMKAHILIFDESLSLKVTTIRTQLF